MSQGCSHVRDKSVSVCSIRQRERGERERRYVEDQVTPSDNARSYITISCRLGHTFWLGKNAYLLDVVSVKHG